VQYIDPHISTNRQRARPQQKSFNSSMHYSCSQMSRREFLKKYKPSPKVIDYRLFMIAPRCRIPMQYSKNPSVGARSFPLVSNTIVYSKLLRKKLIFFKVYLMSMPRIRSLRGISYPRAPSSIKIFSRHIAFLCSSMLIL
jgi:hypothetical protein